MRVAILSDIHGNVAALDAVLADLAKQGRFDQIIVAGDLVWAGPRPREVVDRVTALDAAVIQGNTDAFFKMMPDE
jgi:predicted phosphodiesterase